MTNQLNILAGPWGDANFHRWPPGRAMDRHDHAYLQIIHVLEGNLEVDWGAGWRTIRAGHAHVLPPGARHALRSPAGHQQFGLNCGRTADPRGLLSALAGTFTEPAIVPVEHPVDAIRAEASGWSPHAGLRVATAIDAWALALLEGAAPAPEPLAVRLHAALVEARNRPVSVPILARRLGTSRPTLQRICQRTFGCGVASLHERLRIGNAADRLLSGEDSVEEAAAAAGYGDPTAFSRAFHRVHGEPPGRWRARRRHRTG